MSDSTKYEVSDIAKESIKRPIDHPDDETYTVG